MLTERLHSTIDKYEPKDFGFLFKKLEGISNETIKQHYVLYEGYIKKLNEINEKLKFASTDSAHHNYSEFRELLIEKSHNMNSTILHELYFSNLTDQPTEPSEDFKTIIERDFGSWKNYIEDIKATGMSARAGWAVTVYNYRDGKLQNFAIDLHDLHVPVFVLPVLVMDVWEHAYAVDYGTKKAQYIEAFMKNINWNIVSQRFESALKSNPE